ncbi:MAG: formylglycine-generating enzyme family protein [Elainella sp. Prado103]|jgi:formylglycine-generating enzyme required for sulfatase activity|nr:formylglycine-generating enzyme family protein [Elainella sp. Prado103]
MEPSSQSFIVQFEWQTLDSTGDRQPPQQSMSEACRETLTDAVSLTLIKIPPGHFEMGSPRAEIGWHPSQAPQHPVTIDAVWMGQYPVTQQQWEVVARMAAVNLPLKPKPACFSGSQRPVEQVSWDEAVEFCDRLTQYFGQIHRLPTESEWEYACRAKTTTPFHFGETITTDLANYSGIDWEYGGKVCSKGAYGAGPMGIDRRETTEVGSFKVANAFGLYDMHGLVREWCQDHWHDSYAAAPTDGRAWLSEGDSNLRVVRGGSWNSSPRTCRSAFRGKLDPASQLYDVGFRVVRLIEPHLRSTPICF